MLCGVFADVHSNLEALEVVLDFFHASRVEAHLCCGDLVGYGPNPNECVESLRKLGRLHAVCGNHDLAVLGRFDMEWFNPYARAAVRWTMAALSAQSRGFLAGLSPRLEAPGFTLVHGTPRRPADEYFLSPEHIQSNAPFVGVWPVFCGHSHMPLCLRQAAGGVESIFIEDRQTVIGEKGAPAAYNPGAVGQPRDCDKRASCALWDSQARTFQVFRLAYDFAATQAKMRQCGLPEALARRLAYGQ